MSKPKVALYWCSSCGGCEESVVDLAQDILPVTSAVDIIFWPVAMDFKYSDIEVLQDGEIAATLINGAIRMDEQEHIAKLLRKKSQLIIAHGSCAHLGGVVGLANFYKREDVLGEAFKEVPTVKNPKGILPQVKTEEAGRELELPALHDTVKTLDQVVQVDYYIPGCPPPPELIKNAFAAILENKLPPKGTVLAEKKALCDSCSRKESKPDKIKLSKFKRLYEVEWDPEKCFLEEGIICLGPSTRDGCGERCIKANFPCRGCFGPTDEVLDQGAKSLSYLASLIDSDDEEEVKKIIDSIPDMAGLFYRYSLASSILRGNINRGTK
ncbi:MAG: oxidoreductase [Candidatus Omnitrophota bacterium]|nr:MAG: oxidoreductase [Candidatus Omnitrophota bacterium]